MRIEKETEKRKLQLYVHIPFCVKKCRYCDFLSAPAPEDVRQAYTEQLKKEIAVMGSLYQDRCVTSIFVGGGTPSMLDAGQMSAILRQLAESFVIAPNAEVTVECNPGTVDADKLRAYQNAGVSRLSFGLQSADDHELRLLGRIHTYEQFVKNYETARQLGMQNINVDIISALPGQTASSYEKTLEKVIALQPEHISAYSLIIEEGTPFFELYGQAAQLREKGKEQRLLPSEEEERKMYTLTEKRLQDACYMRYEISNYAKDGFACRHNTGYWLRRDYLGLGLGAASLVENVRFSNTKKLKEYLTIDFMENMEKESVFPAQSVQLSAAAVHREELSIPAQMEEFMFLGLRMMCGVSSAEFQRQFLKTIEEVYGSILDEQLKQGLIDRTKDGYCLTAFGTDVSNYVMSAYLF